MDTRTRLVGATQELLWERGYTATSPRHILSAAQVGQGSMYHHFAGKQELAVAALQASADQMRADARALLAGPGSALGRLRTYLRRQRDCLRGCRLGRLTYDAAVLDAPALRDPIGATFAWLVDEIAAVVTQAVEAGELRATVDPRRTASALVAVVQGGYVLARANQDPAAFADAVEGAVAMLETGAAR